MELPDALNKKIVQLLTSLPDINREGGQKDLLAKAGLDAPLRNVIQVGKSVAFFVPLLVRRLADHGRLKDGRHALKAILEAAKTLVGTEKQKECEKLLQEVRRLAQEQQEPQTPSLTSTSGYVQLILEGDPKSFDQRKRKDLVNALAALLEIDKQFVRILPAQPGNVDTIIIRLSAEKARELVVLFHSQSRKLSQFREQFFVKLIAVLNTLREIALLSDTKLLPEAEKFVEHFLKQHPKMIERRNQIRSTQIKGLENVLSSSRITEELKQYLARQNTKSLFALYLQKQKLKAKRNENPYHKNKEYYLARFYEQLEQKVSELEEFVRQRTDIFPDANMEDQAQWYHYHLVREFLQHLIIDYTFRVQSH